MRRVLATSAAAMLGLLIASSAAQAQGFNIYLPQEQKGGDGDTANLLLTDQNDGDTELTWWGRRYYGGYGRYWGGYGRYWGGYGRYYGGYYGYRPYYYGGFYRPYAYYRPFYPSYYYGYQPYYYSYYYPQVYNYSYYYPAPYYSYYYCPIDGTADNVATVPAIITSPPQNGVTPQPSQQRAEPRTYPYNGGPSQPVPMPPADARPAPDAKPAPRPTVPLEGTPVSIPAPAQTTVRKYSYPAYGDPPVKTSFAEDRPVTVRK